MYYLMLMNLYTKFMEIPKISKKGIKGFIEDEKGAGVIELVLIIVVLIGFVFLFKDKIGTLLNTVFSKINSQAEGIYN